MREMSRAYELWRFIRPWHCCSPQPAKQRWSTLGNTHSAVAQDMEWVSYQPKCGVNECFVLHNWPVWHLCIRTYLVPMTASFQAPLMCILKCLSYWWTCPFSGVSCNWDKEWGAGPPLFRVGRYVTRVYILPWVCTCTVNTPRTYFVASLFARVSSWKWIVYPLLQSRQPDSGCCDSVSLPTKPPPLIPLCSILRLSTSVSTHSLTCFHCSYQSWEVVLSKNELARISFNHYSDLYKTTNPTHTGI